MNGKKIEFMLVEKLKTWKKIVILFMLRRTNDNEENFNVIFITSVKLLL